jgi:3-deoxy-D-manno-octulosonic-acid transferase
MHQFVPLDTPQATTRFLAHWRPRIGVFVESELWPNLMLAARDRGIPIGLINARMSARAFSRWRRVPGIASHLLGGLAFCLAQSAEDQSRLAALGADARLSGNLKFDAPPLPADPQALQAFRARIGSRPVLLAASTHPGEEAILLRETAAVREAFPDLLTILVPRHPERGPEIAPGAPRRSLGDWPDDAPVYVADTLGELGLFYRVATLCVVGGSLVPAGGHNPIEAARLGCPILHGPQVANFAAIYAAFGQAGAASCVEASVLGREIARLFGDERARAAMREAAGALVAREGGAVTITLGAIEALAERDPIR